MKLIPIPFMYRLVDFWSRGVNGIDGRVQLLGIIVLSPTGKISLQVPTSENTIINQPILDLLKAEIDVRKKYLEQRFCVDYPWLRPVVNFVFRNSNMSDFLFNWWIIRDLGASGDNFALQLLKNTSSLCGKVKIIWHTNAAAAAFTRWKKIAVKFDSQRFMDPSIVRETKI